MPKLDSDRALARLEQLAREERAAVKIGDVEAICRISELLPDATSIALAGAYERTEPIAARIEAILASHRVAETYLASRLAETRETLRQLSGGKRAVTGYWRHIQMPGRVQSQG